jgi:hypothetical protein
VLGERDHVVGLRVEHLHVLERGPDVLARHVLAAQLVDHPAHRAHQRLGLVPLGVADDHRLAAAQVHARGGVLVGHPARQAQRVHDRVLLVGVGPHPQAAGGGAERRRVDRDHRPQAGRGVVAQLQLLEAVPLQVVEDRRLHHIAV